MQGVARNFLYWNIMAIADDAGLHMAINRITLKCRSTPYHGGGLGVGGVRVLYICFGGRQNKLATVHFWIHAVSIVVLVVSLYFVLAGNPGVEPVTATSSILFFLGLLLFAWIAIPVINKS